MQDIIDTYLPTRVDRLLYASDITAWATMRCHLLGNWRRGTDGIYRLLCHRCLRWVWAESLSFPVSRYGGPAYWESCEVDATLLNKWALPTEEGTWD